MTSEINFIDSFFYRSGISAEPQYLASFYPSIMRNFPSATLNAYVFCLFVCLFVCLLVVVVVVVLEKPFFLKNYYEKKERDILFLFLKKSSITNS